MFSATGLLRYSSWNLTHSMHPRNDTALPLLAPVDPREHSPASYEDGNIEGSDESCHHDAHLQPMQQQSKSTMVVAAEQGPSDDVNWPKEPRDLQQRRGMKLVFAIMDFMLTAAPIYFIGTDFLHCCCLV